MKKGKATVSIGLIYVILLGVFNLLVLCYVNNSIYADVVPEISECQHQLMMGVEFCYDAIANPKNYDTLRISNKNYTYVSDNQYSFL